MSTYNGEKFLAEQIDSILSQKDINLKLLIRDDGSRDNTVEILKDYAARYDCIEIIEGENAGVGKSFMSLVRSAPVSDYYAFADQDDFWLEDKLIRAVSVIRSVENSEASEIIGQGRPIIYKEEEYKHDNYAGTPIPVLYGSNQILVDGNLNYIGEHFEQIPACDFYSCLTRNVVYGCTMAWNQQLEEIVRMLRVPHDRIMNRKFHDSWMVYCAHICGVFVYDKESRMLYRQHSENVVGGMTLSGIDKVKDKWNRLTARKNKGLRSLLAFELVDILGEYMNENIARHLQTLCEAHSITGAWKLINDKELRNSMHESSWKIWLRCILGWI